MQGNGDSIDVPAPSQPLPRYHRVVTAWSNFGLTLTPPFPSIIFPLCPSSTRDSPEPENALQQCIVTALSAAMDIEVVHDFALSKTLVYPTKAYGALRDFVEEMHETSLGNFVSRECNQCHDANGEDLAIPMLFYELGLLGSFIW